MNATAVMNTKVGYKISEIYYHTPTNTDETMDSTDFGTMGVYRMILEHENGNGKVAQIEYLDKILSVDVGKRSGQSNYYSYKWENTSVSRTVESLDIDFNYMAKNSKSDGVKFIGEFIDDDDDSSSQDICGQIKNGDYGKFVKISSDRAYLDEKTLSEYQKQEIIEKCIELLKTL
jgi:hypothetical protein